MATEIVPGQRNWEMTRNREGHREYRITHLVKGETTDGPATALTTPGLPVPGATWLVDSDVDVWATCKQDATVKPVNTNEPNRYFEVEQTFSTETDTKRCQEQQIEDPLLEPQKMSGGYTRYQEEIAYDRFGLPIRNSAHERMQGPLLEFDKNRPTVRIEQNVALLEADVWGPMIDTVNEAELWGFSRRCVKLSNVSWELKFYGQCFYYYTRIFEFEIRTDTFDRDLADEGTKVLRGKWVGNEWVLIQIDGQDPDPGNPSHFDRYRDRDGNLARTLLDGKGKPAFSIHRVGVAQRYISLADNNVDNEVTDTDYWVPWTSRQAAQFSTWDPARNYQVGDIVVYDDGSGQQIFICRTTTPLLVPGTDPSEWAQINCRGVFSDDEWDENTFYSNCDVVAAPGFASFGQGTIHVEAYDESDFLILNIPPVLEYIG